MAGKSMLIIADGMWPEQQVFRQLIDQAAYIIACDGAAAQCFENGIEPACIIGDMDSLSSEHQDFFSKQKGTKFVKLTGQNENDLVKAMHWSIENGASSIDICGIEGGDFDHHFAAILALCEVPSNARIHTTQSVIQRIGKDIYINHSIEKNTQFSLFPIGTVEGVFVRGAQWPLSDSTLRSGTQGLHNRSTGEPLEIRCDSGDLLLFLNR